LVDKSSALKREHQIKRWTHQEKVDILKLKL
jgi:predicted GIY-YIG superfamily endonuclease